jgi:hypothetical protein
VHNEAASLYLMSHNFLRTKVKRCCFVGVGYLADLAPASAWAHAALEKGIALRDHPYARRGLTW